MKKQIIISATILLALTLHTTANSQTKKQIKPTYNVSQLLTSKEYKFVAHQITTEPAKTKNATAITDGSSITITPTLIESHLPFMETDSPDLINTYDSPLKFKSTDIQINPSFKKNNTTIIEIETRPDDGSTLVRMTLEVSKNGDAILHIEKINLHPVTFHGKIIPKITYTE